MKIVRNKINLQKVYAFYITCALPLLGIYVVPNTNIRFATVCLVCTLMVSVMGWIMGLRLKLDSIYLPYGIYIFFQTLLAMVYYHLDIGELVLSVGQYLIYILFLSVFNRRLFDKDIFIKYLCIVGDITSLYLLFQQFIAVFAGIYIGAGIPFLPLADDNYWTYAQRSYYYGTSFYRPRSLFSEPAMYCTFTLLVLVLQFTYVEAHESKEKIKCLFRCIIYSFGIVISRSSLGVVTLVFLYMLLGIRWVKQKNKKIPRSMILIIYLTPFILGLIFQSSYVQYQIRRLTTNFSNEQRLLVFSNINALDLTTWFKIFLGHDFNLSTYEAGFFMPSFIRHLYCFGVIGIIILIIMLLKLYKRCDEKQRLIFLIFMIQIIGSEILHGANVLFYFVWLLPRKNLVEESRAL